MARSWAKCCVAVALCFAGIATPAFACGGDCSDDNRVDMHDVLALVEIALGASAVPACPSGDVNHDDQITIDEVLVSATSAATGCSPQTDAFIVTTNFMAGSFATIGLDVPRPVTPSSSQRRVFQDAVVRTRHGLLYVVNRLFADNLQVIDPADGFKTRLQCSTGNGTNPHDIAFVDDTKAYVTLYERPELLIVNPRAKPDCSDFIRGTIALGALADGDGIPDMDLMTIVGSRLYVTLERLDINTILRLPAGKGAIAVIDILTDSVIGAIELTGENPFMGTKGLTVRGGKIYVSEVGEFGVLDGGIERVDIASQRAEGFFVTEADLGGDITDFVIVSEQLAYAIIGRPGLTNALVAFNPETRAITRTVRDVDGFSLSDIEMNDRGELYLADRDREHDRILIYRAADGTSLTEKPIDVGLAPIQIVFFP